MHAFGHPEEGLTKVLSGVMEYSYERGVVEVVPADWSVDSVYL